MTNLDPAEDHGPLPPELRELVERVSIVPRSLGFLHRAPIDTIAIVLGVDPFVVDRARTMLETPEGRRLLITELRKARSRPPVLAPRPVETSRCAPPPAETVEELIHRAEEHPLGLRFLMDAPLETVAITMGSHVFLVAEARAFLQEKRGVEPTRWENGEP
jgi:hypothetical protein